MPEKEGVILQAQNASKFIADMKAATTAYQNFLNISGKGRPGGGMGSAGLPDPAKADASTSALGRLMQGLGLVSAKGAALTGVLLGVAGGIAGIGLAAGKAAVGGISRLVGGLKGLLGESIMSAGRLNEMRLMMQLVGQRAGYTSEQLDGYVKTVKEAGIGSLVATELISGMARANLDLEKASQLAAVAADAAIYALGGADTTQTLSRIQYGIQTYNTEVLRTAGLNINMQGSFEKLKKSLNISRDLTETEKQQAALNAVLEEGVRIAGSYDLAMTSPSKALRSFSRYIDEIKISLGAPFQQAFGTTVFALKDLTGALMAAVQEGGVLYPLLIKLGAVASIIADGFAKGAEVLIGWVGTLETDVGSGLTNIISRAFNWGAEIVIQLSEGIIQAAQTVLTQAIQFLGSILTGWLPRKIPAQGCAQAERVGCRVDQGTVWRHAGSYARLAPKPARAVAVDS